MQFKNCDRLIQIEVPEVCELLAEWPQQLTKTDRNLSKFLQFRCLFIREVYNTSMLSAHMRKKHTFSVSNIWFSYFEMCFPFYII